MPERYADACTSRHRDLLHARPTARMYQALYHPQLTRPRPPPPLLLILSAYSTFYRVLSPLIRPSHANSGDVARLLLQRNRDLTTFTFARRLPGRTYAHRCPLIFKLNTA